MTEPAPLAHPPVGSQANLEEQKETKTMEVINGGRGNEKPKRERSSAVLADGTRWETVPLSAVTKNVLAEYLTIVTKAAEAAINMRADDPVEEAARALAAGFGAAMISHGRTLNDEGYEQGDSECKASLGLLGEDGMETAHYHRMRAQRPTRSTRQSGKPRRPMTLRR